ncbi:hypothetical protein [Legionella tucsonensis]|nr:hypothetical protein [Legionella tucsonensis]
MMSRDTLSSEVFGAFTLLLLVFFQVTAAAKVIELSVHGGALGTWYAA